MTGMGLSMCVIGSGSSGNCVCIHNGNTVVLIDQGLPLKRVEAALLSMKLSCTNLNILLTHTHSDHIGGVEGWLKRHGGTLHCHADTVSAVSARMGLHGAIQPFIGHDFYIGDFTVSPFAVSHDVPCVGYSILNNGKKISVATDLGTIPESTVDALSDSDIVLLESNHDENMLNANRRYPVYLKRRILSNSGHLSNAACAETVAAFAKSGVNRVVLGHLSRENNIPELAYQTVLDRLSADALYEGRDINLSVAHPDRPTAVFEAI